MSRKRTILPGVVVSDPSVLEGVPVFAGTKVPVRTLVDYRDGKSPLYEFLADFPEVPQWQAKRFLDWWAEQEKLGAQDAIAWLFTLRDEKRLAGPTPPKGGPRKER